MDVQTLLLAVSSGTIAEQPIASQERVVTRASFARPPDTLDAFARAFDAIVQAKYAEPGKGRLLVLPVAAGHDAFVLSEYRLLIYEQIAGNARVPEGSELTVARLGGEARVSGTDLSTAAASAEIYAFDEAASELVVGREYVIGLNWYEEGNSYTIGALGTILHNGEQVRPLRQGVGAPAFVGQGLSRGQLVAALRAVRRP